MFEQDYIMRLVKEMVRFLLKIIFGIESESPLEELLLDAQIREKYEPLRRLLDAGDLNEAENQLSDLVDGQNKQALAVALLFYSHLNEKDDEFLETHDFSREEVRDGLKGIASMYGFDNFARAFLEEKDRD